jgi:hypothetical protein
MAFPIPLFSSVVWGKKFFTYEVKKAQGSLLVNDFSEFQIFLSWRVLENHFRKECYGSLIEETALHARTS